MVDTTPIETGRVPTTQDGHPGQLVCALGALAVVACALVGTGLARSSASLSIAGLVGVVAAAFVAVTATYRQVFSI